MQQLPNLGHVKSTKGVEVSGPGFDAAVNAVFGNILELAEAVSGQDLSELKGDRD